MEKRANIALILVTILSAVASMGLASYLVMLPTYLSTIDMAEIYFWVIIFSYHFVLLLTFSSFLAKSAESRSTMVKVAYAGIFIFLLLISAIVLTKGLGGVLSCWGYSSAASFALSLFLLWFYNLEMIRDLFIS